jgi:hypothetical protein
MYDQLLILNPDFSLNRTAYEIYGQPWQAGSQVVFLFGSAIVTPFRLTLSRSSWYTHSISLSIGATIVHISLWHGKEVFGSLLHSNRGKSIEASTI